MMTVNRSKQLAKSSNYFMQALALTSTAKQLQYHKKQDIPFRHENDCNSVRWQPMNQLTRDGKSIYQT